MSYTITIDQTASKAAQYQQVMEQLRAVIAGETSMVAVLSITAAMLKEAFDHFWVGFYLVEGDRDELVLGPFQGPMACLRIPKGKGVCGTAWIKDETQVVRDVSLYDGHIACSALTKSEIVIPMHRKDGEVWAVFDIDGLDIGQFDHEDEEHLTTIANIISEQVAPK